MNKKEIEIDEFGEPAEDKIPFTDKRRFNENGERVASG